MALGIDLDDVVLSEAERSRRLPVDVAAVSAGRVRSTPEQATRIVAHLLDNAARYGNERVAVGLRTTDDGAVTLWVDDDGPGIAPGDRQRVFERFTRLEEARTRDAGGAGLGLSVVAALVSESGGSVEARNSPLGGARLTVKFPRS